MTVFATLLFTVSVCFHQAIAKVNAEPQLKVDGYEYVIAREDIYDDTIDLFGNHFFPDEAISRSLGLTLDAEMKELMRAPLQQNLSIALVSRDTREMIGGRVIKIARKHDQQDKSVTKSEQLRKFLSVFDELDRKCNIFEHYQVDEVLYFYGFVVHKDYRHRGIGEKLMRAALYFIRNLQLGGVVIKAGGSSNYSKRVFEKLGFEKLSELVYAEFKRGGKVVIANTAEHKSEIRYGMYLK